MRIQLSKCVVRDWEVGDIPSLVENANNFKIWINLMDTFPHPYTEKDGQDWIKRTEVLKAGEEAVNFTIGMKHSDMLYLRQTEVDGKACGGIGLEFQSGIFCTRQYDCILFDVVYM